MININKPHIFEHEKWGNNSFTRAFRTMHQVTPSMARKTNVQLKSYPRISFEIFEILTIPKATWVVFFTS